MNTINSGSRVCEFSVDGFVKKVIRVFHGDEPLMNQAVQVQKGRKIRKFLQIGLVRLLPLFPGNFFMAVFTKILNNCVEKFGFLKAWQ